MYSRKLPNTEQTYPHCANKFLYIYVYNHSIERSDQKQTVNAGHGNEGTTSDKNLKPRKNLFYKQREKEKENEKMNLP